MRTFVGAALTVALAVVAGSCGVRTGDGTFSAIEPEEVPFRLNEIATTTTSTTSTTSTTVPPPEQPETTAEQTSTTVAPTEPVEIYFVSRDDLLPVVVPFPSSYSRNELVRQLESGPPEGPAAEVGLETLIEPGLITETTASEGVVTVYLDKAVFSEIESRRDQPRAIGQIVLTFTANLRGVGQVAFMLDDEPLRVRKANGLLADEGEAVSFDDYRMLIADEPNTTTSSTTTTAPVEPTQVGAPIDTEAPGG